jgi:hypothetical protein
MTVEEVELRLKDAGAVWRADLIAWDFLGGAVTLHAVGDEVQWAYNGGAGGISVGVFRDLAGVREWIRANSLSSLRRSKAFRRSPEE